MSGAGPGSAAAPADPEKVQLARALLDRERRAQQLEQEVRKLRDMLALGAPDGGHDTAKGPSGWRSPTRSLAAAAVPRPASSPSALPRSRCASAAALAPGHQSLSSCRGPGLPTSAARHPASPGELRSCFTSAAAGRPGSGKARRPHTADAWAAAEAFGADVGLVAEPVSVLRDVLNLRPACGAGTKASVDWRRSGVGHSGGCSCRAPQPGEMPAAALEHAALDCTSANCHQQRHESQQHPQLLQAAVEERLRGAYRAMLLQLQHRYATERDRQEEAHKLQLQEQAEEHAKSLRELSAVHAAEAAAAAKQLEREAAARRADVQRLEALLSAARAAVESSQGQLAAARAAAEALQAQLQLQRATHEAELLHVRQVTLPLQQHDDIVAQLRAEWDTALQQRERDYAGLLQQLTDLRQQMSSTGVSTDAGAGAAGSGSSSSNGGPGTHDRTIVARDLGAGSSSSSDGPGSSATAAKAQISSLGSKAKPVCSDGGSSCGENAAAQSLSPRGAKAPAHSYNGKAEPEPATSSAQSVAVSPQLQAKATADTGPQLSTMATMRVASEPLVAACEGGNRGTAPSLQAPLRPFSSAPVPAAPELDAQRQLQQLRQLRQSGPGSSQPGHQRPSACSVPASERSARQPPPQQQQQQQHSRMMASPSAQSCCSSVDPEADELGTAVFELSEDTRRTACDTAAAAVPAAAVGAPDVTPQSRGPLERPTSAGSISLGRMQCLVDAVVRGPHIPAAAAATYGREGASLLTGAAAADWAESWAGATDPAWAELGRAGVAPQHVGSPEGPNSSDATFGRWQPQQQSASPGAARRGTTGQHTARLSPGRVQGGSPGRSPSHDAGGSRCGRSTAATWGAPSGNPAAVRNVLRCLRCGLNDVSSPGECRFHPALLAQPGSLVFSPEWLTCQAAGHTFGTAGCLVRPQHFYEPRMLLKAQMGPPLAGPPPQQQGQAPSPTRRRVETTEAIGVAPGRQSVASPARGAVPSFDVGPGGLQVAASPPRPGYGKTAVNAGRGPSVGGGMAAGGGGRAGLGSGTRVSPLGAGRSARAVKGEAASPSPRPRSRLPAPLPQR